MTVPITDLPLSGSARERDGDNSQSLDLKKVHQPSPSPRLKVASPPKHSPPPPRWQVTGWPINT